MLRPCVLSVVNLRLFFVRPDIAEFIFQYSRSSDKVCPVVAVHISREASTRRKTTKGTPEGLGVEGMCYLYVDGAYRQAGEDASVSLNHATTSFNHEGSKIVHSG